MARPKKNNADYFSHDRDMRNDTKIKAVRRKFGSDGYAIWNMLLEHLTSCDYFEFELSEMNLELLSGDFDFAPEYLNEVIEYFIKLELLVFDGKILKSEKLVKRFEYLLNKRNREQKPQKEELSTSITPNKKVIDVENPHSIVKYSKVKNSIVNKENNIEERKLKFASTLKEFSETYDRKMLKDFFEYWTEPNKSNSKFKQENEKTWSLERRLRTWSENNSIFGKNKKEIGGTPDKPKFSINH